MSAPAPKFKHDCESCYFVKNVDGYDVYLCNGTIIARYGNDGPDYASMPINMFLRLWRENEMVNGHGGELPWQVYVTQCAGHYNAMARVLALQRNVR